MCNTIALKAKKEIAGITVFGWIEVGPESLTPGTLVEVLPDEENYKESYEFTENIDELINRMI